LENTESAIKKGENTEGAIKTGENTEGAIKKGKSRETGNIGYTRQFYLINVREYRRGNQKRKIQRNW